EYRYGADGHEAQRASPGCGELRDDKCHGRVIAQSRPMERGSIQFFLAVSQISRLLVLAPGSTLCAPSSEVLRMRTNNLAAVPARSQRVMVEAEIDFLVPGLDRPFTYGREAPQGGEAETERVAAHAVQIEDLRHGDGLALEEHGAQLGWWPTRIRRFYDE